MGPLIRHATLGMFLAVAAIVVPGFVVIDKTNDRVLNEGNRRDQLIECLTRWVVKDLDARADRDAKTTLSLGAEIKAMNSELRYLNAFQRLANNAPPDALHQFNTVLERHRAKLVGNRDALRRIQRNTAANPYPDPTRCFRKVGGVPVPPTYTPDPSSKPTTGAAAYRLMGAPAKGRCLGHPVTIRGTRGDDILHGTSRPDVISGRGGDDLIVALDGKDRVCGRGGDDTVNTGKGFDRVNCGRGVDNAQQAERRRRCES